MTALGDVVDEVPVDPARARVYAEGWQSWSPATWYPVGAESRVPQEEWQHLMRFRSGTPLAPDALQAEGLLVVDPGTGEPARLYAPQDPLTVPTVRATTQDGTLLVRATGPVAVSDHSAGGEAALQAFGDTYSARRQGLPLAEPPTVWCSWYHYFERVTAADVVENLSAIDQHALAVDVVQIDDGWSPGLGEGLVPSPAFWSLPALVDAIRDSGRRAGLWLAPFLVGTQTALAREHPDWLVGPAGHNWGQDLVGLDLTHPGVQELLRDVLGRLAALGVDYLKLDFLYGGALPGPRYTDVDEVTAYRIGLELVREAVGPDVYLVGCGAPLLPSVGLVDAMRVSPDTFHEGAEDGSAGLRGLMPLAARAWMQGRLWVNDPDCVVARPSYRLRERWARESGRFGGLASFSDRVSDLDDWGLATVGGLLAEGGSSAPLSADRVREGAALAQAEGSA
ncbi:MAG TPA: glycoside hydrolase family 36 protein [Nocardioides sp.]|uniref:glycoside hydrolase family 36 protein n=1 Tax=Nocardioides sp. TaxID=35761 RepID=UPI002D7F7A93|nr:glycoside hydrolase family 36 protein [Nocardioides sp.]HET6651273.1 glycoside hydrolase family 36 protein [Nocardioides sp.]